MASMDSSKQQSHLSVWHVFPCLFSPALKHQLWQYLAVSMLAGCWAHSLQKYESISLLHYMLNAPNRGSSVLLLFWYTILHIFPERRDKNRKFWPICYIPLVETLKAWATIRKNANSPRVRSDSFDLFSKLLFSAQIKHCVNQLSCT